MQEMNYILNNDRVKTRSTFLTWLFFNKSTRKLCLSSIETLREDLDKLVYLQEKADAARDLDSFLKLTEVVYGMTTLLNLIVKYGYCNRRLTYKEILDLKVIMKVIEKIISEVV